MWTRVQLLLAAALVAGACASPALALNFPGILRAASHGSGLAPVRAVRFAVVPGATVDAAARRQLASDYPSAARGSDALLYPSLGLTGSLDEELSASTTGRAAVYDVTAKRLDVLRGTGNRGAVVAEATRALEDQHFRLQRLAGLRTRDRDAALAAAAVVDGMASGAAAAPLPVAPSGPPLRRFLALEQRLGVSLGRKLLSQLRYYGGSSAVSGALTTFPQTTAQALHLDVFLARTRPSPADARLPTAAAGATLVASETFGELDVRALLATFGVRDPAGSADGWLAGRAGVYRLGNGGTAAVLGLDWETGADTNAWLGAAGDYARAAFPGGAPVACGTGSCWNAKGHGVALAHRGSYTVLASAPDVATASALAGAVVS